MLTGEQERDEETSDLLVRVRSSFLVLHVHEHLPSHAARNPFRSESPGQIELNAVLDLLDNRY